MGTWFLIGMTLMSFGVAISLLFKGQPAWAFVQFSYGLANIGWIYGTK